MNVKGILTALFALLIIAAIIVFMKMQGPNLARYSTLREPAIRMEPARKVLQVEATGAPGKISKRAFEFLMRSYYGLKGVPMGGPRMSAPRARWPLSDSLAQSEWWAASPFLSPIPLLQSNCLSRRSDCPSA